MVNELFWEPTAPIIHLAVRSDARKCQRWDVVVRGCGYSTQCYFATSDWRSVATELCHAAVITDVWEIAWAMLDDDSMSGLEDLIPPVLFWHGRLEERGSRGYRRCQVEEFSTCQGLASLLGMYAPMLLPLAFV